MNNLRTIRTSYSSQIVVLTGHVSVVTIRSSREGSSLYLMHKRVIWMGQYSYHSVTAVDYYD